MDKQTTRTDVADVEVGDVVRLHGSDGTVEHVTPLWEYVELVVRSHVTGWTTKRFIRHGGTVELATACHLATTDGAACGHGKGSDLTTGNPDDVTCVDCKGTDAWAAIA